MGLKRENGKEHGSYYSTLGLYWDNGKENGNYYSILQLYRDILATDQGLENEVVDAGRKSGEGAHPGLFAPELLLSEFDSEFADMKNSVKDRGNAQSSCAGLFIYKHVKHAGHQGRWLHVDMAKPSFLGEYATGYGVGLLCAHMGIV